MDTLKLLLDKANKYIESSDIESLVTKPDIVKTKDILNHLYYFYSILSYYYFERKVKRRELYNELIAKERDLNPKVPEWECKARVKAKMKDSVYTDLQSTIYLIYSLIVFLSYLLGTEPKVNNILLEEVR